ncbi:hypothetical protein ACFQZX_10760 [Mucilaginibacter litoreus]|uniref:Viral A-type inclusion protein n=1 Tax=Mucilaginibacter litoreus TaxID=1048221 RepID=A0ABW3ATC1_9SPHI
MMKKLIAVSLLSFTLFSCADKQKQEKELLNEVIHVHDRVMGKDELIMINKMKLDTVIKRNQSPDLVAKATSLRAALDTADTRMENWMHNFDAENKGKNHEEIIAYLTDQKKQIEAIDSNFNRAVKTADTFIKQNNIK